MNCEGSELVVLDVIEGEFVIGNDEESLFDKVVVGIRRVARSHIVDNGAALTSRSKPVRR